MTANVDPLDQTLVQMTAMNGRVETRTANQAVVVNGRPINHVLHLLLSIFMCSLWIPVWMFITATGGERRTTVSVDRGGNIQKVKAPLQTHQIVLMIFGGLWALAILLFFGSCSAALSH